MTEKPAPYDTVSQKIEQVVLQGDLAALSAEERVNYYHAVCNSLGLNPLTRPFGYIKLNNKLTLYAHKDATDQLRKRDGISVYNMEREVVSDVYVVTSYGLTTDGRKDVATGAVFIKGKTGDALANAMMKAETKSKRRLTLSICGLGFLDESEASSIPATDAQAVTVTEDGEIVDPPPLNDSNTTKAIRPASPDTVKGWLQDKSLKHIAQGHTEASKDQIGLLAGKVAEALQDTASQPRWLVYRWLWDTEGGRSDECPPGAIQAMLDWLIEGKDSTGDYPLNSFAVQELLAISKQAQTDAGQQDIDDLLGEEPA